MQSHNADAIVITCIDFRFQEYINNWLRVNFKPGTYDRGAFAGAAKSLETILDQVNVAHRLHHIKKAVLINHEDCGAYGEEGSKEKHSKDLNEAAEKVKAQIPGVDVESYYLHLDGTFERI